MNNKKLQKSGGTLHPIPVHPKIFHQVGMDLIGPLPVTVQGNRYILTITDYFSKWAEATALPDMSANGIARFLFMVGLQNNVLYLNYNVISFIMIFIII